MCPLPSLSSLSAFPCLHLRTEKGVRAAQLAMGRETGGLVLLYPHPGQGTGAGEDAGRSIFIHGVNPSPAELPVQPALCHHS